MKSAKTQILFLSAAVMFAAAVARISWIENPTSAEACRGAETLLCTLREAMALLFHYHGLGWAALALGCVALARRSLMTAALAMICGGLAMVFYSTDMGAGGFVLGLIALARAPSVRPSADS
jgi:hypothetical protein